MKAERGERRIVGAAPRYAINHQQERVEFFKPPKFRDGACRPGIAAGSDVNSNRRRQRAAQVARSAFSQLFTAEHFNGGWNFFRVLGRTGGSHLDGLVHGRELGGADLWFASR